VRLEGAALEIREQRRGWVVEERIVECATRIWALLEQTPEVNILRLSELLGERNVIAYQALGWLAREKKIHYDQKGSQVFISRSEGGAGAPPDRRSSRRNA
jgi:Winged helix-turn-helix domain (DUF2582)